MNILIVNTNFWSGGASRVSRQLYYGMNNSDCATYFCSGYDKIPLPKDKYITSIYSKGTKKNFLSICNCLVSNFELIKPYSFFSILKLIIKYKIDVIHFQNLHGGYIGILDIWILSKIKPCITTLHDMWVLTGNCVHANSCKNYKHNCLNCRMDIGNKKILFSQSSSSFRLHIKQKLLTSKNIYYVCPAIWLLKTAKQSILKNNQLYYIPNGVNIKSFCFQDKKALRIKYQLDVNKKYIVFLSYDTSDRKKGLPFLLNALANLENPEEYVLITAGKKMKQKASIRQYTLLEFGYTNNDKKLNEIYGLGDIFVIPSLEDTFPCTILESMASGTPIVGFKTGGIIEQIDNLTGFLAEEKNALSLNKVIKKAFSNMEVLAKMSALCRKRVVKLFNEKDMLQKYKKLYYLKR